MKKIFSKEVIIGLCVILTFVILFFGIEFLKGVNVFKASNYYYASFTNVEGLAESAPVTLNGFKVGLVRSIAYEYDNPGHVKVEMSLDPKLRMPEGSKAAMTTDLLGTGSIDLRLSQSTKYCEIGSTIEGINPSGMMDNISQNVLPTITDMIPKIDSLLVAVTAIATDPAIASSLGKLDNIMSNLEVSTRQLAQTMNKVQPIVGNVGLMADNLATASDDVAALTRKFNALPIDSTMHSVNLMADNLASATSQLRNRDSSLGQLLYSDGFYNNLNHSVQSLDSLLTDVKKNPKRYISIKLL